MAMITMREALNQAKRSPIHSGEATGFGGSSRQSNAIAAPISKEVK